jgi:LysM repeat protein
MSSSSGSKVSTKLSPQLKSPPKRYRDKEPDSKDDTDGSDKIPYKINDEEGEEKENDKGQYNNEDNETLKSSPGSKSEEMAATAKMKTIGCSDIQ